jgi:transcriptional regulator with XRE-family HTH domain
MNICERITKERKRLGESQAAFAKKVGVSLSSQKRYETGERTPDVEYLAVIASIGVDINYVLNGIEEYDQEFIGGVGSVGIAIESAFAIPHEDMWTALGASLASEDHGGSDPIKLFFELARISSIFRLAADKYAALDSALLSLTLEGIDSAAANERLQLSAAKKAAAAATLYRAFKASGKIDPSLIEDTVKLAAP